LLKSLHNNQKERNSMPQNRPRFFYGYWILAIAFLCQLIMNGLGFYSFSLYVKSFSTDFNWSRAEIMLAATITSLCMGAISPLIGHIIDRYDIKKIIAVGALILGSGFATLSLTQALWHFYISFAVIGIGSAAIGLVPTSALVSNWFQKRRGWAIGVLGAGIGVGGLLMPLLIGVLLIPKLGWRASFLTSGLLTALLIAPLALLIIRSNPADMGLAPDGSVSSRLHDQASPAPAVLIGGLSLKAATKTKTFWLLALAFITFGIADMAIFQNQVPYIQDIGFSVTVAATTMSVVGIGSAVGKFGFGWLCDFINPKYCLAIGILFQVAAILVLLNVKSTSPIAVLWLYAFLMGLSFGSWLPALSMTISNIFGMASYGAIFGIALPAILLVHQPKSGSN
jgi:MFS family permease